MHEREQGVFRNDPRLLQPVLVRVLRPFSVKGQRIEPGSELKLERYVAEDMKALGKAEILQ